MTPLVTHSSMRRGFDSGMVGPFAAACSRRDDRCAASCGVVVVYVVVFKSGSGGLPARRDRERTRCNEREKTKVCARVCLCVCVCMFVQNTSNKQDCRVV